MIDKDELMVALERAGNYHGLEDVYMLSDMLQIPRPYIGEDQNKYAFKVSMKIMQLQLDGKIK